MSIFGYNSFIIFTLFLSITKASPHFSTQPPQTLPNADIKPLETLAFHNKARAEVGVGPMKWNKTLATYAQNYANKRSKDCAMEHSKGPFGENLAAGWGDMSGPTATAFWLSEKENYDYATDTCGGDGVCGHYTQLVWRDSVRLGCGSVRCKNNEYIWIICSYDPPGNYIGQRPY